MRLLIHHQTEYRYTQPQARVVQLLRMTPSSHIGQNIVDWRIDVDCDARLKRSTDGFGNIVSMLYLAGPVERIGLRVTGEVLTEDRAGAISGAIETLPSMVYTRTTDLTAPCDRLHELLREQSAKTGDALSLMHTLNTAVYRLFPCREHRSTEVRPVGEVLAAHSGCSMDLAHVLISAARASGFAARFVTGYIYRDDPGQGDRQAPHFWAEVDVPGFGWIGFDPANDMCPDERYVRVAKGLDFRDAAPISGARVGGGHEALNVGVDISLSQNQYQS
ncbi:MULTISPECIES: transglutaminase family protein [unclassified Sphingomonas]|uniref:transglutaminase family protein n=1 Tax=unclassified Sphingomonas TaxID=196159 RepID=UPI0006FD9671|nr:MULTISPECIES: transglutaminase family protein [unclassified Sphingomonas]KQX18343.1 transglutaminase [Sphingomonas sp. Root1294]KQY72330.1 transglutaminase [Sphingomonas sp. Root50]KRB94397.1 transglutaminase [Sphingomonas sp. Root720]